MIRPLRSALIRVGRFLAELVQDIAFQVVLQAALGLVRTLVMMAGRVFLAVLES